MEHPPLDRQVMITEENENFTAENLQQLSKHQQEPDWLTECRQTSFELFQNTPMPGKKDEDWRKTDISRLKYTQYRAYDLAASPNIEQITQELQNNNISVEADNIAVFHNNNDVLRKAKTNLEAQGVIWTSMQTAALKHSKILQKYLNKSRAHKAENKFGALCSAFWHNGDFVYIPKNTKIDNPFHTIHWSQNQNAASLPYTLIILDEGAELTYFDQYASNDGEQQQFFSGMVEMFVESRARLQYISLQDFPKVTYNFSDRRAIVAQDGHVQFITGTFGSKLTKSLATVFLKERGAEADVYGFSIGESKQFIDHNTFQIHDAPNTRSNLLYKNAVKKKGHVLYRGTISIAGHAQNSDAYQTNRNLMFGKKNRAESIPALEIVANDVRCSHGATVSRVDPEHLFYLQCRGLKKEEAIKLIVDGFFEGAIDEITCSTIKEHIQSIISQKTSSVGL